MNIGYACLNIGTPDTKLTTCTQKTATPEKLTACIKQNLNALDKMIDYNIEHNIHLFRISSDIIPFGSSPVNQLPWADLFAGELASIGEKARRHDIRLSMHPGQYTVLNSPNDDVVVRAIDDLAYHTLFLDSLSLDSTHKMILHIGGVYGDKQAAIERFIDNYDRLSNTIKNRLIIENDDKSYHIMDLLYISKATGAPVIFDNLHHEINRPPKERPLSEWLHQCALTWKKSDGRQKTHYSQQAAGKKTGSHSDTIYIRPFMDYIKQLPNQDIDIMLEVKDKNLSALKCVHCLDPGKNIKYLEQEWSRYKYTVLERAPVNYNEIRVLLKNKAGYPCIEFYDLIESAIDTGLKTAHAINAAQHVWGYFKNDASNQEKAAFMRELDLYQQGLKTINQLKSRLHRLAIKYNQSYLLDSFYFIL